MDDITTNEQLLQVLTDSLERIEAIRQRRYHNAYVLMNRVKAVHHRVQADDATATPNEDDLAMLNTLMVRFEVIERDLGWLDDASFSLDDDEELVMADEAEWVKTGNEQRDPNGILYLTNQRVVFEQKEVTEKRMGLFGGGEQHEVEFSIPFERIGVVDVHADRLRITFRPDEKKKDILLNIFGDPATWDFQFGRYAAFPPMVVMSFLPTGELPAGSEDIIKEYYETKKFWRLTDKLNETLNEHLIDPIELVTGLGHPDPMMRFGTARALGRAEFASKEDMAFGMYWLMSTVQHDPDMGVRYVAIGAIERLCMENNRVKFMPIPDDAVDRVLPPALQTMTPYDLLGLFLRRTAVFNENLSVRLNAIRLLGDKWYTPQQLLGLLYTADEPYVQAVAAYHLMYIEPEIAKQHLDAILEPLTYAFSNGVRHSTKHVLKNMVEIGDERLVATLAPLLHPDARAYDRSLALEALEKMKVRDIQDIIQPLLTSTDKEARKMGIRTLESAGTPNAIDALRDMATKEGDSEVRAEILKTIMVMTGEAPTAYEDIIGVLRSMEQSGKLKVDLLEGLMTKIRPFYPEHQREILDTLRHFVNHRPVLKTLEGFGDATAQRTVMGGVLSGKLDFNAGQHALKRMGVKNASTLIENNMHPAQLASYRRQIKSHGQNRGSGSPARRFPDKF